LPCCGLAVPVRYDSGGADYEDAIDALEGMQVVDDGDRDGGFAESRREGQQVATVVDESTGG